MVKKMNVEDLLEDMEFEEFAAWNIEDFIKKKNLDEVEDAIETFVLNYKDKYGVEIDVETVKYALEEYYERRRRFEESIRF